MVNKMPIVTAVLTAHKEGYLAGMSFRSLYENIRQLDEHGYTSEVIVILDKPDRATAEAIDGIREDYPISVYTTEFGDQGKARNHAVDVAQGKYIAFLDGDDLWSENWLLDCINYSENTGQTVILHPEYNWFFSGVSSIFVNIEQHDDLFDEKFLRVANYWDAMCFTRTEVHRQHPYSERDIDRGIAFEDWHWNCQTLGNYPHRVVTETIHFKRRRSGSQTVEASSSKSLPPEHELFRFAGMNRATTIESANAK